MSLTRFPRLHAGSSNLRPMLLIGAIFVLSNLAIFTFPGAIFWDDWTLYGVSRENIVSNWTASGLPHGGYITGVLTFFGPGGVRALVIAVGLANMFLLFRILKITPNIRPNSLVLSVALATSFPFFLARVATINAVSVISSLVFLFGWLKLLEGAVSGNRKVSVLGLFFIFFAGVLYAAYVPMLLLVFLHVALVFSRSRREVPWKKMVFVATALFLMHGMVLFFQSQVFPPHGDYEGYRTIVFGSYQFIFFFLGVGFGIAFISLLFRRGHAHLQNGRWRSLELAVLAIIGFLLAVSSYVLIGSFPPYTEWSTRYELNFFIPASLLLLAFFGLFETSISKVSLIVVGALLVMTNIVYSNYLLSRFYVDWEKHNFVTEVLASNEDKITGKFVVVVDETGHMNAMSRSLRFYEWSGIFSEATGTRDTVGVSARDFDTGFASYLDGDLESSLNAVYNYRWENHTFPSDGVLVTISTIDDALCGLLGLSVRNCLSVEIRPDPPSF